MLGVQHHATLFALKVSRSLYSIISSISHGVENIFLVCGVWASPILFLAFKVTAERYNTFLNPCHANDKESCKYADQFLGSP